MTCRARLAPPAPPEEDAARAEELVHRARPLDPLSLAALAITLCGALLLHWLRRGKGSGGGGTGALLPRAKQRPASSVPLPLGRS